MKHLLTAIACALGAFAAADVSAQWTAPHPPFRVHGNTWYVGSQGLSALLLTSDAGHVLIDVPMAENVALIEANIRSLGFRVEDIRLIVNSHPHFDHAGGIAALAKSSGADVRASVAATRALRAGGDDVDDPQYGTASLFAAVTNAQPYADGETLREGSISLTPHATPGHTPGSTTWTWRSCDGDQCLDMVYADSLTAFSNDAYRYSDAAHPQRLQNFRQGLARVAALRCDVLITPHPEASGFFDRVKQRDGGDADALIDRDACRAYADAASVKLDKRIAEETAADERESDQTKAVPAATSSKRDAAKAIEAQHLH